MSDEFVAFRVELKYNGAEADRHHISLYDLSRALYGFERSIALTTHLILNDEVITQATALRGARVLGEPPKEGSFSVAAIVTVVAGAVYKFGTLKPDNPLGHLVHSAYDYAVHKVTGHALDYDKSLRRHFRAKGLEESTPREPQINSLAEKLEPALLELHRPMTRSQTATSAAITFPGSGKRDRPLILDRETFGRMKYRDRASDVERIVGKVAVFNPNTSNGRIYDPKEQRTIPFFLSVAGRSANAFRLIGESYNINLNDPRSDQSLLVFDALRTVSRTNRTTKYLIIRVNDSFGYSVSGTTVDGKDDLFDDDPAD